MRFHDRRRQADFRTVAFFLTAIGTFAAVGLVGLEPTMAAMADLHYLAADPSLRANLQNTNVVMGQATYVGKVLEKDQSWESPYQLNYPGTVVTDPATGQWRMYYEMIDSSSRAFLAMATSTDGIHWTKPALDLTGTTYTTDPHNNFIKGPSTYMDGPNVFVDPNAPAGQQYRMTEHGNHEGKLYADTSADGLTWTRGNDRELVQSSGGFRLGFAEYGLLGPCDAAVYGLYAHLVSG